MARRGFHYDRTAVAHTLIDLVKDGVLDREGVQGGIDTCKNVPLDTTEMQSLFKFRNLCLLKKVSTYLFESNLSRARRD